MRDVGWHDSPVPLFPLPNVVLLPRTVLPLHIFEERYKQMTADALAGDRRIAMALLCAGWEKSYYGRPAIEPVVGVGTIISHEKLADGNYNLLLRGDDRARIVREVGELPYRLAELEPLPLVPASEAELREHRRRLKEMFTSDSFAGTGLGPQVRQMLAGDMPIEDVADLVAFNYIDCVALKQQLLAEGDVNRRISRLVEELEAQRPFLPHVLRSVQPPSLN